MALTFTEVHRGVAGNRKLLQYTITGDASHAQGESITPADFGLVVIDSIQLTGDGTGYVGTWDETAAGLDVFMDATPAADAALKAATGKDLSAVTWHATVIGY